MHFRSRESLIDVRLDQREAEQLLWLSSFFNQSRLPKKEVFFGFDDFFEALSESFLQGEV